MRRIILALVLVFGIVGHLPAENLPNRYPSYAAAYQAAVQQDKRMFVMFTADECSPCDTMKRILFDKEVWVPLNQYFIIHFVNTNTEPDTVKLFGQNKLYDYRTPTMYFMDKGSKNIIGRQVGVFRNKYEFNDWYKFVHKLQ